MRFSILICTIVGREKSLGRLLGVLRKQTNKQVEILVEKGDKKITTGAKRNKLLKRAKGDYIAFIDDDDMVVEDYIPKILQALKTNPDCCGIEGMITVRIRKKRRRPRQGELKQRKFIHSIQYKTWFEKNSIYYRSPNHLNPVKRELALRVGFPNLSVSEDHDYSKRLVPLLKKEAYIKDPIYFYLPKGGVGK